MNQPPTAKQLRPALILSEQTIAEYPLFLEHLFVGLADESVSVILVCPPKADITRIISPAVEIVRYPTFQLPFMEHQNMLMLLQSLQKYRINLLHCLCPAQARFTKKIAGLLNLHYILTINSLQKYPVHLFASRRCVKIVTPTKTITDSVIKLYPKYAHRVKQINPGTFTADSVACFQDIDKYPSLFCSHPFDNVDDFQKILAAIKHLVIDGYEFMLVIMGSGKQETELRKLVKNLGLLQFVTIIPKLQPCRAIFAATDIFIKASPADSLDALLTEAISTGTAVVGCKGGVDDFLIDGRTAIIFDPDDELSIYNSIKKLLDGRELARNLAANAQQYLKENNSVSKMISAILQLYHQYTI